MHIYVYSSSNYPRSRSVDGCGSTKEILEIPNVCARRGKGEIKDASIYYP